MKTIIKSSLLLCLLSFFCMGQSFAANDVKEKKYFKVATKGNWDIDKKTSWQLMQMYYYYEGANTKVEDMFLLEVSGVIWLAFQAAEGSKGDNLMVEMKVMSNGDFGIIFDEPLGIRNCKKADGCTQCKVSPCGCGRNGGTGSCIEEVTEKVIGKTVMEILMG